jgi:ribosomal protein L5
MPKTSKEKNEALIQLKDKLNIKNINAIPKIEKVIVAC